MIPALISHAAEMTAVWSDVARFERWLEVELLATEAHAAIGVVPEADAAACRGVRRASTPHSSKRCSNGRR